MIDGKERFILDIDGMENLLRKDIVAALRMLASEVESGNIDCKLLSFMPHGFAPAHDTRAHIRITLDVAADVHQLVAGGALRTFLPGSAEAKYALEAAKERA